jgi:DNA-binding HxlR family transcriptional regulator
MLPREYTGQNCSVARSLEVVGERWTLLILRDAMMGVTRFEAFQRRLRIAPNMLAKRLRTLTDVGILERRLYSERPDRHEYALTERGRELFPVVMGLMRWGDAHLSPRGAPALVCHARCEGEIDGRAVCLACGAAVGVDEVTWHYGPGSGRAPGPRPVPPGNSLRHARSTD